jgi:hypothetical protein
MGRRAALQNAGIKAKSFTSTPTRGGDAFGMELAESHRFSSSRLSLAFEGLLLGASLCLSAKPTSSDPHQLGLRVHIVFMCVRLFLQMIECSEGRASGVRANEQS